MLGDTAVAVHPENEKLKHLIARWRSCRWSAGAFRSSATTMPIRRRATGGWKITPAHDFNDFEVGRRHDSAVSVLDKRASSHCKTTRRFWGRAVDAGARRDMKLTASIA